MSKEYCESHKKIKLYRPIFFAFLAFIAIVLLTVFIIWLVLRPTHPRFVLQDAVIYQFNATAASFLTTALRVTLLSRNPNDGIGVYYDRLDVYGAYRNQQITLPAGILPSYQGHKEITVWSPVLTGADVPISQSVAWAVEQDQIAGNLVLNIRADGQVRFKVGTWVSSHYRINVNCAAYFQFGVVAGVLHGGEVKLQEAVGCAVDV